MHGQRNIKLACIDTGMGDDDKRRRQWHAYEA